MVITPSVTRSTPSISAMGGTSERFKVQAGLAAGLSKISAPRWTRSCRRRQCACPPWRRTATSFGRSRRGWRGGPKSRFIGSRLRMRTTQAVASSPGLVAVELVALVDQYGGKRLGRVARRGQMDSMKVDDILPLPAEVVTPVPMPACGQPSLMAMKTSFSLQLDGRFVDLLSADVQFGVGVIVVSRRRGRGSRAGCHTG